VYDLTHPNGGVIDHDHPAKGPISRSIAGKGGSALTVHTHVNLDGQKIATAVSKVQAREANGPQTGISGFDGLMAPFPAGGLGH
jgi:hypothetical protein